LSRWRACRRWPAATSRLRTARLGSRSGQRFSIGIDYPPRGYAPRYWQRAQRLPVGYYAERRHYLADYRRFDLYDPPYFAHWVRVGSEALDVIVELLW